MFGGYVSGPIVLAASFLGIRTIIHEQNAYPGKANRILARFVNKIAISFPDVKNYFKGFESKVIFSGNKEELLKSEDSLTAKYIRKELLWNHLEESERMGRAARLEYEQKYTPERNHQLLMEIYERAIKEKKI